MTRCPQLRGERGSLKWIQRAVNYHPEVLNEPILRKLPGARAVEWRSPLEADEFSEYRDAEFLERIGAANLADELRSFWPRRGPQWDALARTDSGEVLLVEAKAHIGEVCSTPAKASDASRQQIEAALKKTASFLNAKPRAPWATCFYQLTNRIAHLYFLRKHRVPAWLVLVNFLNDGEMRGPASAAEWEAAYQVVWHVLGVDKRHKLAPYIVEVHPDVRELSR